MSVSIAVLEMEQGSSHIACCMLPWRRYSPNSDVAANVLNHRAVHLNTTHNRLYNIRCMSTLPSHPTRPFHSSPGLVLCRWWRPQIGSLLLTPAALCTPHKPRLPAPSTGTQCDYQQEGRGAGRSEGRGGRGGEGRGGEGRRGEESGEVLAQSTKLVSRLPGHS